MLRRSFRQSHQSGSYSYGIVEEVHYGYVTVKLGSKGEGPRLTNLSTLGGEVDVGELVIVDASTRIPKVRPIQQPYQEAETIDTSKMGMEWQDFDPALCHMLYVYGNTPQDIYTSEIPLLFTTAKFDTGNMFSPEGGIVIPTAGYYLFIAHAAVQGFPDNTAFIDWDPEEANYMPTWEGCLEWYEINAPMFAEIFLKSNLQGVFGYGSGYSVDTKVQYPTFLQGVGMINAAIGEEISVTVKSYQHDHLTSQVVTGMYPRLMGHRLNRDGGGSNSEGNAGDYGGDQQNPPPMDDSDIELGSNQGYLHVADTDEAYARAIAQCNDFTDAELLVTFRFQEVTSGGHLKFWMRASRDWFGFDRPTNGYEVSINSSGGWNLAKVSGGVRSILDSMPTSGSTLAHYLRFQTVGNWVRAKIWLTTDTEPDWEIQFEDVPCLGSGALSTGLFRQTGEHKAWIDDLNLHAP